jgi:hypothetical protein
MKIRDGASGSIYDIDNIIDNCPHCGRLVDLQLLRVVETIARREFLFIFQCANAKCRQIIICVYSNEDNRNMYRFGKYYPKRAFQNIEFSEAIKKISESFVRLYNQASKAEHYDCKDIAGTGYRKALEFLIKDYAIRLHHGKEENIKKKQLSPVIKEYIDNKKIKAIATGATWIGNDETHYTREWPDTDINDLKTLIAIVADYIDAEEQSDEILKKMSGQQGEIK